MPGRRESKAPSLEGYLFPETYFSPAQSRGRNHRHHAAGVPLRFPPGVGAPRDGARFRRARGGDPGFIIEKETGDPSERPLIASVFHNRLKRGMRLETDPTVIYAIKDFDGNLTRKHLETPTPFNTYIIEGCLPDRSPPRQGSLKAASSRPKRLHFFCIQKQWDPPIFNQSGDHQRASSGISSVRAGRIPAAARPTE